MKVAGLGFRREATLASLRDALVAAGGREGLAAVATVSDKAESDALKLLARELGVRVIDTVCIASYAHNKQGELQILKGISDATAKLGNGTGKGILIVDDLVDTGKTARMVREMLPDAHFATVYAKPMGRPLVDTFITEVSQDTWIFFPWDLGLSFQPPMRDGAA